jgi:hypothetical protein
MRRRPRARTATTAALTCLTCLAWGSVARADDAQAFELGKAPFDNGQYAEAHTRLSTLLDPAMPACDTVPNAAGRCRLTSPELVERVRALDAASLLALRRDAEADILIGAILRQNPDYLPSPAMFPQEVIERFSMVRTSMSAELRAIMDQRARAEAEKRLVAQKARDEDERWIAELQRLAASEKRVEPNSRWVAMVPFGVGQFQNGDIRVGVVFAVGEALLGGASLVSVAVFNSLASTNISMTTVTGQSVDIPGLNAKLSAVALVNRISFGAFAALTLAGVVHAQVTFVPEKVTYHDRPIPPRPKLVPLAAPLPGGAVLGLGGTF